MDETTHHPLGTPDELHQLMRDLVLEYAPRRFAIWEEYGDRVDGRIFAWGMAFEERVFLRADDETFTGRFDRAEQAVRIFSRTGRQLRLLWLDEPPPPGALLIMKLAQVSPPEPALTS